MNHSSFIFLVSATGHPPSYSCLPVSTASGLARPPSWLRERTEAPLARLALRELRGLVRRITRQSSSWRPVEMADNSGSPSGRTDPAFLDLTNWPRMDLLGYMLVIGCHWSILDPLFANFEN